MSPKCRTDFSFQNTPKKTWVPTRFQALIGRIFCPHGSFMCSWTKCRVRNSRKFQCPMGSPLRPLASKIPHHRSKKGHCFQMCLGICFVKKKQSGNFLYPRPPAPVWEFMRLKPISQTPERFIDLTLALPAMGKPVLSAMTCKCFGPACFDLYLLDASELGVFCIFGGSRDFQVIFWGNL